MTTTFPRYLPPGHVLEAKVTCAAALFSVGPVKLGLEPDYCIDPVPAGVIRAAIALAAADKAVTPVSLAAYLGDALDEVGGVNYLEQLARYSLVVVEPTVPEPASWMALAICWRRGASRGAVKAVATRSPRLIWPDVRDIALTHSEGGRA